MGGNISNGAGSGDDRNYPGVDRMDRAPGAEDRQEKRPRLIYAHPCPAIPHSKDTKTKKESSSSEVKAQKTRLMLIADSVSAVDSIELVLGLLGLSTKLEIKEIQTDPGSLHLPTTIRIYLKTGR